MGTIDLGREIEGPFRIVDIPKELRSRKYSDDIVDSLKSIGVYSSDWDWYGDDMGFKEKGKRNKAYKLLYKW